MKNLDFTWKLCSNKSQRSNQSDVSYPIQEDRQVFFNNEISILKRLNRILQNNPVENGVGGLIAGGNATWHSVDDTRMIEVRYFGVSRTWWALQKNL